MPNRPKAGSGSGGGGLRSWLLQKMEQDNYAAHQEEMLKRQKELFDYENAIKQTQDREGKDYDLNQKLKAKALEEEQFVTNVSGAIRHDHPDTTDLEARAQARYLISAHGDQLKQLGLLGAENKKHSDELSNTEKQQAIDLASRVNPSKGDLEIAENTAKRNIAVANAPFGEDIARNERAKAAIANVAGELGNTAQATKNQLESSALNSNIEAANAKNSDTVRVAKQSEALNALEQAAKARKFSIEDSAPSYRYRTVVQPPSVPGQMFKETQEQNFNFNPRSDEALMGASGVGATPNTIKYPNGATLEPLRGSGSGTNQPPTVSTVPTVGVSKQPTADVQGFQDIPPMSTMDEYTNFRRSLPSGPRNVADSSFKRSFADTFGIPREQIGSSNSEYSPEYTVDRLFNQHPEIGQQLKSYETSNDPEAQKYLENLFINLRNRLQTTSPDSY